MAGGGGGGGVGGDGPNGYIVRVGVGGMIACNG
jgi:hypothetical protein